MTIALPSGISVADPIDRLRRFCQQEFDYYDGVPGGNPDCIEPIDVLATVGINSRIDTALKVRTVHRSAAAACNRLLQALPHDADLLTFEPLDQVVELLAAAMTSKFVLLASACKVLHRKRPRLVPVLDSVVVKHYLTGLAQARLLARSWESRPGATEAAGVVLAAFREDLLAVRAELEGLALELSAEGFPLSLVRILDIIVWTETEPSRSYITTEPDTSELDAERSTRVDMP
jgi:hypothetical protein